MKKIDKLLFIINIICKHKNITLFEVLAERNCNVSVNKFNKTGVEVWYYYNKLNDIDVISFSNLLVIENILVSIKNISIDGYGNIINLKTNKKICIWDWNESCLTDQKLSVINAIYNILV